MVVLPASVTRALTLTGGQVGVMGAAQARRAAKAYAALSAKDRAAINALFNQATSDMQRASIVEALGAGHSTAEVARFACTIRPWSDEQLLRMTNLADVLPHDGKHTGLRQQWRQSCVPAAAQVARASIDPIYALQVRAQNDDVNRVDPRRPFAVNRALAEQQKAELESHGGTAVPRQASGDSGVGLNLDTSSQLLNHVLSPASGDRYKSSLAIGPRLAVLFEQVRSGKPAVLYVGSRPGRQSHAVAALETKGTGANEALLIHDPWAARTFWVTRQAIESGGARFGAGTSAISFYSEALGPSVRGRH